jgi:hypothetical protein
LIGVLAPVSGGRAACGRPAAPAAPAAPPPGCVGGGGGANTAGPSWWRAQLSKFCALTVYARKRMLACEAPQYSAQKPFQAFD